MYFDPDYFLNKIEELVSGQERYAQPVIFEKFAETRVYIDRHLSRSHRFLDYSADVRIASQAMTKMLENGAPHHLSERELQHWILDKVLYELEWRWILCELRPSMEEIQSHCHLLCKANDESRREIRMELHQRIKDLLVSTGRRIDGYEKSKWGWVTTPHVTRVAWDVYYKKEEVTEATRWDARLTKAWVRAVAAHCLIEMLAEIFEKLREIDKCVLKDRSREPDKLSTPRILTDID